MPNVNKTRPLPTPWKEYLVEVAIVAIGLAAVNGIFFAKAFRQTSTVSREAAGQLGSFVGGYVGSVFSLTGVVLLFSTLRNQRRASQLANFENKYFELIKMHRDNVAESDLQGASGRKLFVLLIRELRCALEIVREVAEQHKQILDQRGMMRVAYYCLFFGVGPNSSRMLKMSLADFDMTFVDALEATLNNSETKKRIRVERKLRYTPFEGHQSRLGHYYRHLYQMVQYVDRQTLSIDKYDYVKTIRAQLSTHEQALLLVNSVTPMGQDWWDKNLLFRYRFVQNIPRAFFDDLTELNTSTLFERGYFEWEATSDPN